MMIVLLLGGFVGLVIGGDMLVRGAVTIAQRLNISPMVIGLTLVGFGTSMPELLTSVQAALAGAPGIAIGNVIGSNTANILLILGLSTLLAPIAVPRAVLRRDGGAVALATLACVGLSLGGQLGRGAGAVLLCGLVVYLVLTLWRARAPVADAASAPAGRFALLHFAAGLVLTVLAARALVTGAIGLSAELGISEAVIGVTVVAVGTSLPELVTSIMAARARQGDIALGNILGSNLFNLLGILGVTALIEPLRVPSQILELDLWVMAAATLALLVMAFTGSRIGRGEGAALFAAYVIYIGVLARSVI
ncbi:calcium/sodium antiporter [Sedimentitalea sp. CAU 1593]|uniref:Calcium/sodium antiporter n=2 Tax=Sedimentitalea arenosa TaxID=2798803 RepID=A0A8J7LZV3_9RHOB|nr:calcium/sodium antiporter [Arenibacterium arenosum]